MEGQRVKQNDGKRNLSRKWLLISCWGVLCLLFFSGCAPIEKIQQWKTAQTQAVKGEQQQTVSGNQLYLPPSGQPETNSTQMVSTSETVEVALYFADAKGEALVAEKRTIAKEEGIARATINALLQGPQNNELQGAVPAGTALRDINIKEDGCCIVDFNKSIMENQSKDKNGEMMTVAAIVQTLEQFSSIKEVQILVEGRVVETLAGQVDISVPIQTGN